ncbi:ThiJ/PfpI domain-containing protein, partial [Cladochytrium replicatum]
MPLHIGCVIFPAWELLDLLGPFSVLLHAASLSDDQVQFYFVASNISEPIESFSRLATIATVSVSNAPQFDIILVPGGAGAVRASNDNTLLAFLRTQAAGAKFVASICTGSGILANAGLLKNRRATSNKAAFGIMSQYGSNVKYVRSARFIEDGNIWSASGVTAGVDMAFEITRRAFSDEIATSVAKSWGYEPLEGTYDPFCDHHPEP